MTMAGIIQARMGSTRLPGKVLLKILDKTILEHVIERVRAAKNINDIIIATSHEPSDQQIVDLALKLQVKVFRGSETDVLDRYYQAAKKFGIAHVVRITADCPLIDPEIIDTVIDYYFGCRVDYCSNTTERTFPDGLDTEVFSFESLEKAWREAKDTSDREHVTTYIYKHPNRFKVMGIENKINLGEKRWTLDRHDDFQFIKAVIEALYPDNPLFRTKEILEFLKLHPFVEEINRAKG